MGKVCVVGSCNIDTTVFVNEFPTEVNKKTEAIKPEIYSPGGKGANQAVACARLGNEVSFIGCIGNDKKGEVIKKNLEKENIDVSGIETVGDMSDGRVIYVKDGENRMFGTGKAIKQLSPQIIDKNIEKILEADIVMIQLKMPEETIKYIIEYCHENGKEIVVNPAPEDKIDVLVKNDLLDKITYLTPNSVEGIYLAEMIKEKDKDIDWEVKKQEIRDKLSNLSDKEKMMQYREMVEIQNNIVVTIGSEGAMYYDKTKQCAQIAESYKTKCVDDTGAGDTFNGAFVSAYLKNKSNLKAAVDYGNKAASIKVGFECAQQGMPTQKQIEERFQEKNERE